MLFRSPSLILSPPYLFALRSSPAKTIITLIFSKDLVVFLLQNHTPAYCICFLSRRIVLKSFKGAAFFANLVSHHSFDHNDQGRSESDRGSALFSTLHPYLTLSLWNIEHRLLGLRRQAWVQMCAAVLAVLWPSSVAPMTTRSRVRTHSRRFPKTNRLARRFFKLYRLVLLTIHLRTTTCLPSWTILSIPLHHLSTPSHLL